ncbi:ARM repeat-containing protein [Sistotremastrum suecicum HHB10207 ss-3]|uniref:ARM repeat-containing protein n=1 Tax=Sistotremastrum suecicum HHB10207 ss-3 TaxID=1314776 RepID=A0A166J455_9AGAM|nr:ARM repeat-containing protein [Sistotremastrum suecicum HHB10207 ss-3]
MDPLGDELTPIAILIDELKSEDVQLRLNAIHRISTIALALGPERARDELIPFLRENVDDEDDEVLLALAEELGKGMEEFVGGRDYGHVLFIPLEHLAVAEETLVRDKATDSIIKIAAILSPSQLEEYYIPMLKRLSQGEWFSSRTSSASLYASAYPRVSPDTQAELRKLFTTLGGDDTPMVRRAVSKWLGPFAKNLSRDHVISDALPLYRKLSQDDQDSVRLLTVEDLITIAQQLGPAEVGSQLLPQLRSSVTDKSWRVRYMVANHFVELAEAVGPVIVRDEMVTAFVQLLKDNEAEVRTAGAGQIPGFAKLIDNRETILAKIIPCVKDLSTDSSQHVRAALANQLSGLAPLLDKEATIENLLPLFLHLLKDEFPDVRLNIISKLEQVNSVIGNELLSQSLLPAIMELAEDKQWRVRQAIIEYIPLLATQLGRTFFDEQLANLCMSWLGDSVYSIREAATINLKKLTEVFGVEWAKVAIVPKVAAMGSHPNYLYRMTTVLCMTTIGPSLTVEVIRDHVLQVLLTLITDPIPNIRFNVAKSLEVMATTINSTPEGRDISEKRIAPAVDNLRRDVDADVRYFANRAFQKAVAMA